MSGINRLIGVSTKEDFQKNRIGEVVEMLKNSNASGIEFFVCPDGLGLKYVKNEGEKNSADLENLEIEIQKNVEAFQSFSNNFKAKVCVNPKADELAIKLLSKLEVFSANNIADKESFDKNLVSAKQCILEFKIQKALTQNCIDEAILKFGDDKFQVRQMTSKSIKDLENCYKKARAKVAVLKSLDEQKAKRTKHLDKLIAEYNLQAKNNPILKHMSSTIDNILTTTIKQFQIYHNQSQQPISDCQEIKADLDNTKTSFASFLDCANSVTLVKK